MKRVFHHGELRTMTYENTDGETVSKRFLGVSELDVVLDKLGDGAELSTRYLESVDLERQGALLSTKQELGVFAPITPLTPSRNG